MQRWLPVLLILALIAIFRVLGAAFSETLPNLQPLPAVLLCSLIFLKGIERWLLPLAVWIVTDPLTSLLQGYPVFGPHHLSVFTGIAIIVGIAFWARRHATALPVIMSAAGCALAFYFVTNLFSFALDPLYPKTVEGFVQAQWTGPIGFGPTWIFLRNLLIANLLFTGLFLAARVGLPKVSSASPAPAR